MKRKGGDVLLRHEISLKVICEKVKFSNCEFCNNFRDKLMVHARADMGTQGLIWVHLRATTSSREGQYGFTSAGCYGFGKSRGN